MRKDIVIVTGSDEKMGGLMLQAIASMFRLRLQDKTDIAVMDLGLNALQREQCVSLGLCLQVPTWEHGAEELAIARYQVGLVARPKLRDYFPGYKVYVWFDADAWAQTDEFFGSLVAGARQIGAAVVREDGYGYRPTWAIRKWWIGNMIAAYGLKGVIPLLEPAINNGIFALSDNAPHWDAWIDFLRLAVARRGILCQHSMNAAIALRRLPVADRPARMNWQPTLSAPILDQARKLLLEPGATRNVLSVIHLTGRDKLRKHSLVATDGSRVWTDLTYGTFYGDEVAL